MQLISCPHCGSRAEIEFRWGGEAHAVRPEPAAEASDAVWAEYLYFRKNLKGVDAERWLHAHGCRQWFNMLRDSTTHEVVAVYAMGEAPPASAASTAKGVAQ
jgi:sarcosine oxidase subunit delta